jgi:enoyl-CoA hydratase
MPLPLTVSRNKEMAATFTNIAVKCVGRVTTVQLRRPAARNAIDALTAKELRRAFEEFDRDANQYVAVLHSEGDTFCAGADLKALARNDGSGLTLADVGPLGPTSLDLSKPVIAAIQGYAVAGGLELALWADLRVADETAKFGVFCRRFGVPLVDGGTVRLPRLVGHSHAMDLILTGREVGAEEALRMGLANRVVPAGKAFEVAMALAEQLCAFPQQTMRDDRRNAIDQWQGGSVLSRMTAEREVAVRTQSTSGPILSGSRTFAAGKGRKGAKL